MTQTINSVEVLGALKNVVAEAGAEHRHESYEVARYVNEAGRPACIVGRAAETLGLPLPEPDNFLNQRIVGTVARELEWDIEDDALHIFREAQRRQDSGEPWGDVLLATIDDYVGAL